MPSKAARKMYRRYKRTTRKIKPGSKMTKDEYMQFNYPRLMRKKRTTLGTSRVERGLRQADTTFKTDFEKAAEQKRLRRRRR